MEKPTIPISDLFKLAVLALFGIAPQSTEHDGRRYWELFAPDDLKVLKEYETGALTGNLRDFVSALQRVKDRMFEAERRLTRGDQNHVRHTVPH